MRLIRGFIGLCLLPLLTLLASILAIIQGGILRSAPEQLQWIPMYWGRILAAVNGVKVEVKGLENVEPGKPYIFAANHQSMFDIFSMQGFFDSDFRWLAKKELFRIPLFGRAMHLAGYISIDRSHGREALKSLKEAAQRIAAGTSVILFPEGTRSLDGKLHDFKSGGMVLAIKSGVPVVPVGISGTYEILPKGKLLAKPGQVTIRVGQPVETKDFSASQKHELATMIQHEVARLIGDGA